MVDVITTMVSQMARSFEMAIKEEALFINLQSKNKEQDNKTSKAEEAMKKTLTEVRAMKK